MKKSVLKREGGSIPLIKSPFRYPGGKSRLLSPLLDNIELFLGNEYHDVFVGGGSVLLAVASAHRNVSLFANDLNPYIACFWKIMTNALACKDLIEKLPKQPTIAMFNEFRSKIGTDREDRSFTGMALTAIFFNRTTFSGILDSGPIGGYEQKGKWKVDCRWNHSLLVEQIHEIHNLVSGRLTVCNVDFYSYLNSIGDVCCYLDPPYFEKGKELYDSFFMSNVQHTSLAGILRERRNWILSYDDHPIVRDLYKGLTIKSLDARYSVTGQSRKSWNKKTEIVVLGAPENSLPGPIHPQFSFLSEAS